MHDRWIDEARASQAAQQAADASAVEASDVQVAVSRYILM